MMNCPASLKLALWRVLMVLSASFWLVRRNVAENLLRNYPRKILASAFENKRLFFE
jgi:hypothetical protein